LRVPTLRKVTVAAEDEDQEKELESKRKVGDDDDDDDDDREEDWIQIRKNDLEKETTVAKASSRSEKSTIQEVVTVDPAERSLYIH
jgi:hypothetical protein